MPECDAPLSYTRSNLKYNAEGLVPAIAQQHDTGEVLMMAWMNRDAVAETLRTGRVCYYSRSRQALWRKGEASGNVQVLRAYSGVHGGVRFRTCRLSRVWAHRRFVPSPRCLRRH